MEECSLSHITTIPRLGRLQPLNPEDQRVRVPFVRNGRQAWERGAVFKRKWDPPADFLGFTNTMNTMVVRRHKNHKP